MSTSPPCPICKKPAKPRTENPAFPFCSARCKQVELGKWLNEEYRLPVEEEDDDPSKSGAGSENENGGRGAGGDGGHK